MTILDVEALLTNLDAFTATMHMVRDAIQLEPKKEHIATCIDYQDLQEMRSQFVEELVNTVVPFVYSEAKQRLLVEAFQKDRPTAGAWTHLARRARKKFRSSDLRGQFSELILCNILQHYFRAAPLLRKMPLTTNPQVERHGADAIHIGISGGKYVLYLGEAKTYDRATGSLGDALVDAITDIQEKHAQSTSEISLYAYEDFIPAPLEQIARDYIDGKAKDLEVHLVCVATYGSKATISGDSRDQLLAATISALVKEASSQKIANAIAAVPTNLRPRLHYVIFPVSALTSLIDAFKTELGV